MSYSTIITWIQSHPVETAVICYALLNLCKRFPPPKNPRLLALWTAFESLMVLGWQRFGGPLKTVPSVAAGQSNGQVDS